MQPMPKGDISLMGMVVSPAPDMAEMAMKMLSTRLSGGLGSLINMMLPKKAQVPSTYARWAR